MTAVADVRDLVGVKELDDVAEGLGQCPHHHRRRNDGCIKTREHKGSVLPPLLLLNSLTRLVEIFRKVGSEPWLRALG